jgi:hypothetical protein
MIADRQREICQKNNPHKNPSDIGKIATKSLMIACWDIVRDVEQRDNPQNR